MCHRRLHCRRYKPWQSVPMRTSPMPPSQDQDLHVIELTELIEQGKPSVTESATAQGAVALSRGTKDLHEDSGNQSDGSAQEPDTREACASSADTAASGAESAQTGTVRDTASSQPVAQAAPGPADTTEQASTAEKPGTEPAQPAQPQARGAGQPGTISPLLAGMLPGLVDKISGLSHDCALLHERMEQLSLRQSRLDEACRLRAGTRGDDGGSETLADLDNRLKALEDQAATSLAGAPAHEQFPAALATRLSDCEEQLGLFATREDMDRSHQELLACVDNLMAQCKEEGEGLRRQLVQLEARIASQEEQLRGREQCASTDDVRQVRTVMEQCLEQQADFKSQQEQICAQVAGLKADAEGDRRQMETLGSAMEPLRAELARLHAQRASLERTERLKEEVQDKLDHLQARLAASEERVNSLGLEEESRLEALQAVIAALQQMVREQHETLCAQLAGERQERTSALDALALKNGEEARNCTRELEERITVLLNEGLQERTEALSAELSSLNDRLAREEEAREKALTAMQDQLLKTQDAHAACLRDVSRLQNGASETVGQLRRLEEELGQEREERRQGLAEVATLGTGAAESGKACRAELTGVQAMALKLAEDQSVLSARLSVAEDKLAAAPSSLSQLVDSASQQVGQKVLEDLSDFIRNFVTTHTTAYEERLAGLEARLAQSLQQEQALRQSLEEQQRINQDLTARLQALEHRVSEEALEQTAARACVRILREEIGRLMGGTR